ncbi:hypothetical protein QAA85_26495, partial [Serratia nevei]|uniref:hypothetical protein n=1 Tax=Serratia nevei TaxID=2703794 RepID=UPI00254EF536
SAILWKPPAHSPEENMVRQKCSGIRRSYLAWWFFQIGDRRGSLSASPASDIFSSARHGTVGT